MSSALIAHRAATQAGFTLIELLVVTAILGLISYVALDTVARDTSPTRLADTRARLDAIRTAVLGTPAIGGNPGLSGFVADMGRLPNCPQELMMPDPLAPPTSCTPGIALNSWKQDIDTSNPPIGTGLGYGWRGPYLHAFREMRCSPIASDINTCTVTTPTDVTPIVPVAPIAFRDGWGNTALGQSYDGMKSYDLFGWRLFGRGTSGNPDMSGNFYVQSYGSDGETQTSMNTNSPDVYANDYPPGDPPDPLVAAQDYQIALPGSIKVRLINGTSNSGSTCLSGTCTSTCTCTGVWADVNATKTCSGATLATSIATCTRTSTDFTFTDPTTGSPSTPIAITNICASLHYVAKDVSTNQTTIATLYTEDYIVPPGTTIPSGESLTLELSVPTIPATLTSAAQTWLPAGPIALRLRGTSGNTCGTSSGYAPTTPPPLLEHTYDWTATPMAPTSTAPLRCQPTSTQSTTHPGYYLPAPTDANASPGRACGTIIFNALPPSLPQQPIDVTLWP